MWPKFIKVQPQAQDSKSVRLFLLKVLMPFKFWILGYTFLGMIWAMDLSLRPYLLKLIIDRLSFLKPTQAWAELTGPIALYLGFFVFIVCVSRLQHLVWLNLNTNLKQAVGQKLVIRMMDHSISLFQNQFAGSVSSKIKEVMSGVPDLVGLVIEGFLGSILGVFIAVAMVWHIHFTLSFLMAAWIGGSIVGTVLASGQAKNLFHKAAEVRASVLGRMVDLFSNILSVQLFAAKKNESLIWFQNLEDYVKADRKRDLFFLWMLIRQSFYFCIYQTLICILLVQYFKIGIVTAGDFALVISINMNLFISTLRPLYNEISQFSDLIAQIQQGLKIVLSPLEIQDKSDAKILHNPYGNINFQSVHFGYPQGQPLFQNLSISIPAGQKVGVVGYSGGGKTTFINLILRLYDVTDGAILIDGQDIRDVTQDSLRANISMIPQDSFLFHRSLMENIRYGRPEASDEEVFTAAKSAYIHEFIERLPEGYESLVGERGIKLSGGQRQRIAIARAFLKNAPILVLDEATSQLDSVTETWIQKSLQELMQNKTTIIIAHRLSTLLQMDRILVFNKGQILQDGTHQKLLDEEGLYKELWDAQVGGFLGSNRHKEG
ncbi:MAG: ABC transporter permease [Alphaproteobacteria bacterium 40-19]|nr:MAG: ABC transporter permease [Alphaproteobacteria bacterium 40-19]